MRKELFVGLTLTVAALVVTWLGGVLDLELESVALLGAAMGAVVGLVPDRTAAMRLAGFVGGFVIAWVGFFVPGKTSDAIVAKLNGAINEALSTPEMQEKLAAQFMRIERRDVADTRAYFDSEIKNWTTMIISIGLTLD